jgi:hypothetical protein
MIKVSGISAAKNNKTTERRQKMLYPSERYSITFKAKDGRIMTDERGDLNQAVRYANMLNDSGNTVLEVRNVYRDEYVNWEAK